jgi:hypothetical protein
LRCAVGDEGAKSPAAKVAAVGTVVTASADLPAPCGSTNVASHAARYSSKPSKEELNMAGTVVTASTDLPAPRSPFFAASRRVAAAAGTTLSV